jgi:hypothetical protein
MQAAEEHAKAPIAVIPFLRIVISRLTFAGVHFMSAIEKEDHQLKIKESRNLSSS